MNVSVRPFPRRPQQRGAAAGGEPPYDDRMEVRIVKLEEIAEKTGERLTNIERDLAVMKAQLTHFATKADVSDAKASIIMWVVSAVFVAQLLPLLLKRFGV